MLSVQMGEDLLTSHAADFSARIIILVVVVIIIVVILDHALSAKKVGHGRFGMKDVQEISV